MERPFNGDVKPLLKQMSPEEKCERNIETKKKAGNTTVREKIKIVDLITRIIDQQMWK